jgi:hypothetical protein
MAREANGPRAFFAALSGAFAQTVSARGRAPELIGAICAQAFDAFEGNVALQAENMPPLACKGECSACCGLRVVVTAPEVFMLARFIAVNAEAFRAHGVNMVARIAEAAALGKLPQEERMGKTMCPFIHDDLCVAYRLRPLACRGHSSYDRAACEAAMRGESVETAVSEPHLVTRSLVQNAMMSALRDAGLDFSLYELNAAVLAALSTVGALESWLAGGDPLAAARLADFDAREAGEMFDALRAG